MTATQSAKIAFMHIPKTGGTAIVDAFQRALGEDHCLAFSNFITDKQFEDKQFVSGHVYLGDIAGDFFKFTFLRNPLKQIVSHLSWIDRYNDPRNADEFRLLPTSVQQAVLALKDVDFGSATEVDRYLRELSDTSDLRVRNLQAELVSFKRGMVQPMSSRALAQLAISRLGNLHFLGLCESMSEDMQAVFDLLNIPFPEKIYRLNVNEFRRPPVDLRDIAMRRTLERYVEADQRLYDHVQSHRNQDTKSACGKIVSRVKRLVKRG
ncbi:sulfotransferase family 2 domain-containing protein [Paraburkholderia sp. BR10954]|uniref:sulfotransferase family 2 domain-containing protein n=1 Tax=Paraburkholderia sp. BR10954 TaxID=3236995 RepID=UPI0034D273E4